MVDKEDKLREGPCSKQYLDMEACAVEKKENVRSPKVSYLLRLIAKCIMCQSLNIYRLLLSTVLNRKRCYYVQDILIYWLNVWERILYTFNPNRDETHVKCMDLIWYTITNAKPTNYNIPKTKYYLCTVGDWNTMITWYCNVSVCVWYLDIVVSAEDKYFVYNNTTKHNTTEHTKNANDR